MPSVLNQVRSTLSQVISNMNAWVGLTNASRLDKASGPQTFRPQAEGHQYQGLRVGCSSDPSDIAMRTSCHGHMSKWIDPNPNGWSGVLTTKSKKK